MALPARPMHVPAGLPIDQVTRKELLDVGKANVSNVNVRQVEIGCLSKRLGFEPQPLTRMGEDDREAGRRLFAHKGVPTVIDGTYIDSFLETPDTNVTRSRVPECSYRLVDVPSPSPGAFLTDAESCSGYVAVSYGVTGTDKIAIIDAATGGVVRSPETVGAASGTILLASYSHYFIAFVQESSSTAITAHILDTDALDTGWAALATVAASSSFLAMSVCSLSNRVAVAYGTTSGTNRVTVKTYSVAGLLETATIPTSSTTPSLVDVHGSIAGTLWITWNQTTDVKVLGLDADALAVTLATVATAVNVASGVVNLRVCEGSAAGTARLFATDSTAVTRIETCSIETVAGAAASSAATRIYNAVPSSRPFQVGGRFYMTVFHGGTGPSIADNTQANLTLVDWTEELTYVRPLGHFEPGLVIGASYQCKFSALGDGKYVYGFTSLKSGGTDMETIALGGTVNGCQLLEIDFASRNRWQPVDHANVTFLSGALLSVYDGERVTESGILARPTKPTTGATGGTGITGTFKYVAIYEDVDAAGNWIVSGISVPSEPAVASTDTVTVSTMPLTVSSRLEKSSARVAFYRTGGTGGNPPYYRLGTTTNDTTAAAISYADTTAVADLEARAKLYAPNLTSEPGASLDRRAPPGLVHIESYAGMLVGAKGESLYGSGQEVYGEATWFSPVFEQPVTGGGDITGLKAQDGVLAVFKADRVYLVSGEAPSDNGLQGGLGVPRLIAADAGCVEANSIVATSLGIFFRSRKTIEILTRSQTVEPIGEAIQATLDAFPVVTSAVLDDRNGLVRFSLAASESGGAAAGNGRDVVFDLTLKSWVSVDDKTGSSAHEPSQSAAMVYHDGATRYAWLGADGTLWTERDEDGGFAYRDDVAFVPSSYEIPPWKLGLQQEQRIYEMELLFEQHTDAGLLVEIARDYGGYSSADDKEWTADEVEDQRQVSFRPKPYGTAVQCRISDVEPEGFEGSEQTGQGLTFIGLSADIAPKQGPTRGTTRLNPELRR